jgi:hypothetical protein
MRQYDRIATVLTTKQRVETTDEGIEFTLHDSNGCLNMINAEPENESARLVEIIAIEQKTYTQLDVHNNNFDYVDEDHKEVLKTYGECDVHLFYKYTVTVAGETVSGRKIMSANNLTNGEEALSFINYCIATQSILGAKTRQGLDDMRYKTCMERTDGVKMLDIMGGDVDSRKDSVRSERYHIIIREK